jgi:hypothetical protein
MGDSTNIVSREPLVIQEVISTSRLKMTDLYVRAFFTGLAGSWIELETNCKSLL